MNSSPGAEALLADLPNRGFPEAEIYEKRGRSRRFVATSKESPAPGTGAEAGPESRSLAQASASEEGWAVRAGDRRRSLFHAATGSAEAALQLVDPSPHPLLLPDPQTGPLDPWRETPDFDSALVNETGASQLFQAIEREMRKELRNARLVAADFEEGSAESALLSTRGVRAAWRTRAAALRLEVRDGDRGCRFEGAESMARDFDPLALARRLVDRLCALEPRRAAAGSSGPVVLIAAPLAARLIQACAPLFVGPASRGAALGALSPAITLIDDGRFASGVLAAPFDGEGLPSGPVTLVETGRFVRSLLAWWETERIPVPGCARRASWRDLPRRAPTHLYLLPSQTGVAELVESVGAGAYLLDAEGPVRVDRSTLAFDVAVSGLEIVAGRAVAPLGAVRLCGDLKALLTGIRQLGRDLQFVPGDGMFGAPSLVVEGLRVLPL
ncbi:MAG: metallopeptidase TldD-related protein [Thermoanaerobaculia bacterium]